MRVNFRNHHKYFDESTVLFVHSVVCVRIQKAFQQRLTTNSKQVQLIPHSVEKSKIYSHLKSIPSNQSKARLLVEKLFSRNFFENW